ncbi:MAG: hypothetical protein RJA59_1743 [Pseudomonadota bacterium]
MTRIAAALLAVSLALPAVASDGSNAANTYKVVTDGSVKTLAVGKQGKVLVDVVPLEKGIHVNREFPLKYKVEPSAGLKVDKVEWKRTDAVDPAAENPRFEIPVTAVAKGAQVVSVQMRFAICSDAWCVPQTKTVTVPIEVK